MLFWLLLTITLFIVATAPVELAHTVRAIYHAVEAFFNNLSVLIRTLKDPLATLAPRAGNRP